MRAGIVAALLNAAGWTVADLARRSNVDHSAISRILNGKLQPGNRSTAGLLQAFGRKFPRVGFYDLFEPYDDTGTLMLPPVGTTSIAVVKDAVADDSTDATDDGADGTPATDDGADGTPAQAATASIRVDDVHPELLEPDEPGGHAWVMIVALRVTDAELREQIATGVGEIRFDNARMAWAEVGCAACERPWTYERSGQPCRSSGVPYPASGATS